MKKRNKKYNPKKQLNIYAKSVIKNRLIAYFANDDTPKQDIILTNMKGDKLEVSEGTAKAITEYRHNWSLLLAVFCIEKGLRTCKFELVKFNAPYLQSELVEWLNEYHQSMINKHEEKNVKMTGAGWIASPEGLDLDEDECGLIFEKLGAF